jgi:hypothetical protein
MHIVIKRMASVVLAVAITLYGFVGLTGILFGPYELGSFLRHDVVDATVFNQIRFFKALELGMGVGFFVLRRRVHDDATVRHFVAFVLGATPVARLVSLAIDGVPSLQFQLLTGVELIGAAVFGLYAWSLRPASLGARQPVGWT